MSVTPEIKIGVLLGLCPTGRQALATWALRAVTTGMQIRGPDMSLDMRLLDVSIETPVSEGSESFAVGLSGPLGRDGASLAANTAAYVAPNLDAPPVAEVVAGRGLEPATLLGAGWLAPKSRPSWQDRWLCACR